MPKVKITVVLALATSVAGVTVLLVAADRAIQVTNYDGSMYIGSTALLYLITKGVLAAARK